MMKRTTAGRLGTLMILMTGLSFAPYAFADDEADVLAIVQQYGDSENDLEAQSKLMRSDRVFISGGVRQTNEEKNMSTQIANRKHAEAINGGKTQFMTTIEDPEVAVYGNVAVASFIRIFNVFPHNQPAIQGAPVWVTLVLVKENGAWGIAHTHQSPAGGN